MIGGRNFIIGIGLHVQVVVGRIAVELFVRIDGCIDHVVIDVIGAGVVVEACCPLVALVGVLAVRIGIGAHLGTDTDKPFVVVETCRTGHGREPCGRERPARRGCDRLAAATT